jgi:hypothetical protein
MNSKLLSSIGIAIVSMNVNSYGYVCDSTYAVNTVKWEISDSLTMYTSCKAVWLNATHVHCWVDLPAEYRYFRSIGTGLCALTDSYGNDDVLFSQNGECFCDRVQTGAGLWNYYISSE